MAEGPTNEDETSCNFWQANVVQYTPRESEPLFSPVSIFEFVSPAQKQNQCGRIFHNKPIEQVISFWYDWILHHCDAVEVAVLDFSCYRYNNFRLHKEGCTYNIS